MTSEGDYPTSTVDSVGDQKEEIKENIGISLWIDRDFRTSSPQRIPYNCGSAEGIRDIGNFPRYVKLVRYGTSTLRINNLQTVFLTDYSGYHMALAIMLARTKPLTLQSVNSWYKIILDLQKPFKNVRTEPHLSFNGNPATHKPILAWDIRSFVDGLYYRIQAPSLLVVLALFSYLDDLGLDKPEGGPLDVHKYCCRQ
ncbi:hypothetical protein M422DRAFT_276086 [Sphaerobolus stellatus SS14]|uniref:Uncharacterized protein n=1 Tax=Sphaerobolus stellatus (strain SS14) TaxID=990650 RepID=A0A0C9UDX9_SPHS4|nr:hypothetical protein M422DRAFT_276086 [Sphaerobolus stellatus SS14]